MAIDFPNSPTTGQTYTAAGTSWKWDGAKWVAFSTPAGAAIIGTSPPLSPNIGTEWWDSNGGQLYVYYDDGNSAQWVVANSLAGQANVATVAAYNNAGRNLIHNPLFNIAQRGTGPFNTTPAGGYLAGTDRWRGVSLAAGDSFNFRTVATTDTDRAQIGDESAQFYVSHSFTGGSGAGNAVIFSQAIEGVRRLGGKTVTVSFWAICGTSLKIGVSLTQDFGSGGSPSASVTGTGQSITATPTWARYSLTFTVPSTAGKTLGTNNNDQLSLEIWLSGGSSFATRSGSVPVQNGFINMWGVQLEIGSTMTPLEKPDPQQDLAKCQRFYCGGVASVIFGQIGSGQTQGGYQAFPVTMRAAPTMAISGTPTYGSAGSASMADITATGFSQRCATTSTIGGYALWAWTASADL